MKNLNFTLFKRHTFKRGRTHFWDRQMVKHAEKSQNIHNQLEIHNRHENTSAHQ